MSAEESMLCLTCGYDLRGCVNRQCPECGRPYDPADPETYRTGHRKYPRWLGVLQLIAASHPLMFMAVFYFGMLIARIQLGHWPIVYQDNPEFGPYLIVILFAFSSCFVTPVTVVLALVCLPWPFYFHEMSKPRFAARAIFLFMSWGIAILLFTSNPGGCWEWFFD